MVVEIGFLRLLRRGLRLGRLPGQGLDGAQKVAPVKKHHKIDRPATFATTFATIENLILDVDRKAIVAAALRTWPAALAPAPAQLNAAPGKLVLDPNGTDLGGHAVRRCHGSPPSIT
jgi:hypothetical protein